MTSALDLKTRVEPSLTCILACVQWIPQIHLWCDTCRPLGGQHGSWSRSLHVAEVGCGIRSGDLPHSILYIFISTVSLFFYFLLNEWSRRSASTIECSNRSRGSASTTECSSGSGNAVKGMSTNMIQHFPDTGR